MNFFKRLLSFGLCAGCFLTSAQAALIDTGFTYGYRIGAGTHYSHTYAINGAGTQRANAITYQPSADVSPIGVRSGTQFYGNKKSLSEAAAQLENQGYDVIGGINADFFSTENGIPTGVVVDKGRIIACNTWQHAVGFRADGSAVIGQPVTSITVSGASGKVGVYGYNKTRTSVGLYLLDSYYYNQTRFSTPGQSIILEYENKADLRIGHPAKFKVVGKQDGATSFPIAENQMILTKRSDCTAPWIDYPIGEEITITFNSMMAGWDEVVYAVGGKKLVTAGQSTPTSIDRGNANCARTAVGIKADGSVVLFEVDGESSYSKGLNANQLAAEMIARGCVDAVCLDGGGSSTMTVQEPGTSSTKRINRPNGGSTERKVSNFIFLVNNKKPDGIPTYLYMVPTARYILPHASTTFSLTAMDDASTKTTLSSEVSYTVSGGNGVVSDGQFQAGTTTGPVTVSAVSGNATGDMHLMIVGTVTDATFSTNGKEIASVSIQADTSIDLDASLSYQGFPVASQDHNVNWRVQGDIGTIDENGVFTGTKKGTGTIIMSYGDYSKKIPVSVGMGAPQPLTTIADFESTQPFTAQDAVLTHVQSAEQVARGRGALSVSVNDTAILSSSPTSITSTPVLSFWAKTEQPVTLIAQFIDTNGMLLEQPISPDLTQNYQFISVSAPQNAQMFTGFRVSGTGTLWLDHVQVSQSAPISNAAPVISFSKVPESISIGDSLTITAKITQEHDAYPVRSQNVKAYLNGTLSSATYQEATASISIPTGGLGAGLHTVVVEATDDAGNLARKAVTLQVGKKNPHIFVDTSTHWAADYIDRAAARGIVQGATTKGKSYYYPKNNLKRSEFAVMMARMLELDMTSTEALNFIDADEIPNWAKGAISAMVREGLMSGSSTGRFNPNSNITRAEVMAVISRSLPRGYAPSTVQYTDADKIPDWAKADVQIVSAIGLVNGYRDGSIQPNGKITRGEIAKIFCYL